MTEEKVVHDHHPTPQLLQGEKVDTYIGLIHVDARCL